MLRELVYLSLPERHQLLLLDDRLGILGRELGDAR